MARDSAGTNRVVGRFLGVGYALEWDAHACCWHWRVYGESEPNYASLTPDEKSGSSTNLMEARAVSQRSILKLIQEAKTGRPRKEEAS